MRCRLIGAGTLVSVMARAAAQASWAANPDGHQEGEEIPFAEADLFIELNDTDGDLGVHALIDGDAWKQLQIEDPAGRGILFVRVIGRLARQGLTELFFESDEPNFDELSPEVFFRRFPEGSYDIEGLTLEGDELESTADLTHVLPAPPGGILLGLGGNQVPAADDCDAEPLPVIRGPVVIDWEPVTQSHPELGAIDPLIDIVGYQVVVEREEPSLLVFSVDLPLEVTRVRVPGTFIALADEFKFEIVVREASGNQTAVESCFAVE